MKHIVLLVLLATLSCQTKTPVMNDPIPDHDSLKIESKFVNETRVINIWTPPTYKNSTDSFPVLYMPDGGIKEDFPHVANTIAKLVKNKSIPPIILVGIENTERRRDLTGFSSVKDDEQYCPLTDGAKDFRQFIKQELFQKIESNYRVTTKRGIIGESLAGLFVVETIMQHPETFDYYIAFDPSLWWNNHALVKQSEDIFNQFPSSNKKLWFAGSDAEDIYKHTRVLAKTLENQTQINWKYADEPKEHHHTIFRASKEKALIWMFNESLN
ncbi:MAG: alpha/beta hydrolase [Flavobacteriales bacterium]